MNTYNVLLSFPYRFKTERYSLVLHKGLVKTLKINDATLQIRLGKVITEPTTKKIGSAFVYVEYPNGNVYSDIMCLGKKGFNQN